MPDVENVVGSLGTPLMTPSGLRLSPPGNGYVVNTFVNVYGPDGPDTVSAWRYATPTTPSGKTSG